MHLLHTVQESNYTFLCDLCHYKYSLINKNQSISSFIKGKEEGKDQRPIQSSTTDPGH